MHNKISALTLALLITGSALALELTPGEIIIQQEAAQAAKSIENAPRQNFITTQFGQIESRLVENKEDNSKLELIVKQKLSDPTAPLALGGIAFLAIIASNDNPHFFKISNTFFFACTYLVRAITDCIRNDQYINNTTINLEKDIHGNWAVVNSAYDSKMNARFAKAAMAIEHGNIENTKVFEKLEKIFAAQQN